TYVSHTRGIQAMVVCDIISSPGGKLVCAVMDRQAWYVADPTVQPSTYGVAHRDTVNHCWSIDYASTAPSTIVALINGGQSGELSCYSSDRGQTWTQFATPPTGSGGAWRWGHFAASTSTNFCILAGTTSGPVYYTIDGGSTWTTATGLP